MKTCKNCGAEYRYRSKSKHCSNACYIQTKSLKKESTAKARPISKTQEKKIVARLQKEILHSLMGGYNLSTTKEQIEKALEKECKKLLYIQSHQIKEGYFQENSLAEKECIQEINRLKQLLDSFDN